MLCTLLSDISQHTSAIMEVTAPTNSTSSKKRSNAPASVLDSSCSDSEGSQVAAAPVPSGLILKSGRVRLPDRLMEYLNKEVAPEALYWMPEGESFAINTEKAPEQILSKFFSGTKLSSFLRSISRWGFKRVFYHDLEKNVYAFHHPLFKKASPHLEKEMKMLVSVPSQSKKAKKSRKASEEAKLTAVAALPAAMLSSPLVLAPAQQPSLAPSPGLAAPSAAALAQSTLAGQMSTLTFPAVAGQGMSAGIASPTAESLLQARLLQNGLFQPQQQAPTPPTLALNSLLQQRSQADSQRITQLLALQGATSNETGRSSPTGTVQDGLLRLVVARQQLQQLQQQRQQQQQQQALLDLLAAFQQGRNP